jgi:hypothetical protein
MTGSTGVYGFCRLYLLRQYINDRERFSRMPLASLTATDTRMS